ncbi:MAG TPA: 50S ribosomal protein L13 [bacterium]|nr:50S ribosomal protein L13 [bacterium]
MIEQILDVKNKSLGRAASEAAAVLRGKNRPDFAPNRIPDIRLIIENIDKIKITGDKLKQKKYIRHSTYPGSLRVDKLEDIIKGKGIKYVFEKAVSGMLPKNKLKKEAIKRLIIK